MVSDPIILFDRLANRWVLLEIGGTSAYQLCTYVSKTSDPVTGGWWFYSFATPALPDYPHCGIWDNAYVCTTNEDGSGAKIYAFDRVNMLTGATARPLQRFTSVPLLAGYGFQALTPVTFLGTTAAPAGSAPVLARHYDDEAHAGAGANTTADFIDLYRLKSAQEVIQTGVEDCLYSGNTCFVEWPERAFGLLPENTISLHFTALSDLQRKITWQSFL